MRYKRTLRTVTEKTPEALKLKVKAPSKGLLWYKSIDFIHRLKHRDSMFFHSNLLTRLYSGNYKKHVVEPLVEAGLLEVNDSYKVGSYSKRYTLLDHDYSNWVDHDVYYHLSDGGHVFMKYVRDSIELPDDINTMIYNHVNSRINTHTVETTSVEDCMAYIYHERSFINKEEHPYVDIIGAHVYTYGNFSIIGVDGIEAAVEELKEIAISRYKLNVSSLREKDYYVIRGKKSNRLYHPINQLPKSIRNELTIDGERLVQIDMKNAQFALWTYGVENSVPWSLYDRVAKRQRKSNPYFAYNPDIMPEPEFLQASKQGVLYEYMSVIFNESDRELTKKMVFRTLFGSLHHAQESLGDMKERLPRVVKKLRAHKAKSREHIAIDLQNLEAMIFIDYFLPNLVYRGIPCVPVHDCVLVKESDVEATIHLIRMLSKEIDLQATFEIDGKDKFNTMATTCPLVSQKTRQTISFKDMALPKLYDQFLATL